MQSLLCVSWNEESPRHMVSIPAFNSMGREISMRKFVLKKKMLIYSIIENGEENCKDLIDAHLKCMREQGFNI